MKIQILSDLHLEFAPYEVVNTDVDLLILAGDIRPGDGSIDFVKQCSNMVRTLFVPGNHEYYGEDFHHLNHRYQENIPDEYLNLRVKDIDGIRVAGCTLWSNFGLEGVPVSDLLTIPTSINDFFQIGYKGNMFSVRDCQKLAEHHYNWLDNLPDVDIVVTHFSPTGKSIADQFKANPLNAYYCNSYESLITKLDPKLWVHGHTHSSFDYTHDDTRIVCNPRGYCSMYKGENGDFEDQCVIEI